MLKVSSVGDYAAQSLIWTELRERAKSDEQVAKMLTETFGGVNNDLDLAAAIALLGTNSEGPALTVIERVMPARYYPGDLSEVARRSPSMATHVIGAMKLRPEQLREAIDILAGVRSHDPSVIEFFFKALQNDDAGVRASAADGLGRITGVNDTVVPRLLDALADPEFNWR